MWVIYDNESHVRSLLGTLSGVAKLVKAQKQYFPSRLCRGSNSLRPLAKGYLKI